MREIKFRIFDGKEMIYPTVIDFEREQSMDYYNWYDGYSGENYKFAKYPLMQYTGLKDKNGKEIYEGDVIRRQGVNLFVSWSNEDCAFDLVWPFGSEDLLSIYMEEGLEVIGNRFENPDLINPT